MKKILKMFYIKDCFTKGSLSLFISLNVLTIFGSLMIVSAEMGNKAGSVSIINSTLIKQLIINLIGVICFIYASRLYKRKYSRKFLRVYSVIVGLLLISTRLFAANNGAYGWIVLGPISIQPSELAKIYIIFLANKLLGKDRGLKKNKIYINDFVFTALAYVIIVLFLQKDLGSAAVIGFISFVCIWVCNINGIRNFKLLTIILFLCALVAIFVFMTPFGIAILEKYAENYQIARFLSSVNPFKYQYDYGYHLVMSLISFGTGGLTPLGYGNSIHKYMNFPNPSNDFILPVIVEELGIYGFFFILVFYFIFIRIIMKASFKTKHLSSKIVYAASVMFLVIHFLLNVGGVSGLIPLTGVPLLLISSGGTSTFATFLAFGLSNGEMIRNNNENNSR